MSKHSLGSGRKSSTSAERTNSWGDSSSSRCTNRSSSSEGAGKENHSITSAKRAFGGKHLNIMSRASLDRAATPTKSSTLEVGDQRKMEETTKVREALDEELVRNMSQASLEDSSLLGKDVAADVPTRASSHSLAPIGPPVLDRASKILKEFLLNHENQFVRVNGLRQKGWFENEEKGDAFFKIQRARADQADDKDEKNFYNMMIQIGEEMHRVTGALTPKVGKEFKVLDLCMAPGGYAAAVLKLSSKAKIYGITLDQKDGGHAVLLDDPRLKCVKHMDITMLAKEFSSNPVPKTHPGLESFSVDRPFLWHKFSLVLCDGIKLRTQERPEWREKNEPLRLTVSQLILALKRLSPGGTIIMLMHKVDMWPSVRILYAFNKFARVRVFKPVRKHQVRSSFYMIAQDVKSDSEAAKAAMDEWKRIWWKTTCGGHEGTGEKIEEPTEKFVNDVIDEFGEKLIELGRDAWRIQADALSKTEYAGDGSGSSTSGSTRGPKGRQGSINPEAGWRAHSDSTTSVGRSPDA